jgi:CheY-like chemotaxis protein
MSANILVVEDNRENMNLMEYLLRAFGYTPLLATSGAKGVRLAAERHPDVILMDVQMPEMDGYQATAVIRRDPNLALIPIIAVTAFAMVGDGDRILASGFDGYIPKPIAPETFVSEVEAFLPEALRAPRMMPAGGQ